MSGNEKMSSTYKAAKGRLLLVDGLAKSAILYFHPIELLIDFLLGIGNVLPEEDTEDDHSPK